MRDVGEFRLFRSQKLPASGQVKEELSHLDGCARGAAGGFDLKDLSATDHDLRSFRRLVFAVAGGQCKTADARDTGQGFTAEPHGGNGGQIFSALNLAGRMSLETEERIVSAHSSAVIRNSNEASPARLYFHRYSDSAGIDRILDQFLHHARGAFDHLSCGDLIGYLFR